MARSANEFCMFCMSTPCACNKKPERKPKQKPQPATPPPPPPPLEAPKVRTPAKMPAPIGTQAKLLTPKAESRLSTNRQVRPAEEVNLENAVTYFAAAGLLSEESIKEHERLIKLPATMIDALKWRDRVRKHQQ